MVRTRRSAADDTDDNEKSLTVALLGLVLTPGLGIRSAHRVLSAVGGWPNAAGLGAIGRRDLEHAGLDSHLAGEVLSARRREEAEREWEHARRSGARILRIGHPDYPPLLAETADAPLVLYVRGAGWNVHRPHVAIVGARGASPYGLAHARNLARDLASRGAAVVSGLARGIDTAAHQGALEGVPGGGHVDQRHATVAVLGTGIDVCYPMENRPLAESISAGGALVSEFPLGTPPLPAHFPRRNRIIAGMAWGTIVVEARSRSGSLITARLAADANREVFAVPGPLDSERSRGTHELIRSGACLVRSVEDVIAEFPPHVREQLTGTGPPGDPGAHQSRPASSEVKLSGSERTVMNALSTWKPTPIDQLVDGLGLRADEVYTALTRLELAGLIDTLPGDRYVRKE